VRKYRGFLLQRADDKGFVGRIVFLPVRYFEVGKLLLCGLF
jgi:hypothetical protein